MLFYFIGFVKNVNNDLVISNENPGVSSVSFLGETCYATPGYDGSGGLHPACQLEVIDGE